MPYMVTTNITDLNNNLKLIRRI